MMNSFWRTTESCTSNEQIPVSDPSKAGTGTGGAAPAVAGHNAPATSIQPIANTGRNIGASDR
jgi:hypothetical protein